MTTIIRNGRRNGLNSLRFSAITLTATLVVTGLGACSSSSNQGAVSYDDITSDLTPELRSQAQRPVDIDSALASYKNKNMRSFWDDLGRVFYTDAPSRLTPFPVNNTTGQPR